MVFNSRVHVLLMMVLLLVDDKLLATAADVHYALNVTVGNQVSLICPSTSFDNLDWVKNLNADGQLYIYQKNQVINKLNKEVKNRMDIVNQTILRINNTNFDDTGEYRCTVKETTGGQYNKHIHRLTIVNIIKQVVTDAPYVQAVTTLSAGGQLPEAESTVSVDVGAPAAIQGSALPDYVIVIIVVVSIVLIVLIIIFVVCYIKRRKARSRDCKDKEIELLPDTNLHDQSGPDPEIAMQDVGRNDPEIQDVPTETTSMMNHTDEGDPENTQPKTLPGPPSSSSSQIVDDVAKAEPSEPDPYRPSPRHSDYNTSRNREQSFNSNWPHESPLSAKKMANAGFFYIGVADQTKCYFCSGILSGWNPEDDPEAEHDRECPDCQLTKRRSNTPYRNATVDENPLRRDADTGENQQSVNIAPVHPQYQHLQARLKTFSNWSALGRTQPAHAMAQAGFTHEGPGDSVVCFHCNNNLKDWDPSEDPWIEHARWFPTCQFVIKTKGQAFVQRIRDGNVHLVRGHNVNNPNTSALAETLASQQVSEEPSASVSRQNANGASLQNTPSTQLYGELGITPSDNIDASPEDTGTPSMITLHRNSNQHDGEP